MSMQSIEGPIVLIQTNKRVLRYALNMYLAAMAMFDENEFTPLGENFLVAEYADLIGDIARTWRANNVQPDNDAGGLNSFEDFLHCESDELFKTEKMHALRQCMIHIAELHEYS